MTASELQARGVVFVQTPHGTDIMAPRGLHDIVISEVCKRMPFVKTLPKSGEYGMCDTCCDPLPHYRGGMCLLCCVARERVLYAN